MPTNTKRSPRFLETYLQAGGKHPKPKEALHHFDRAFVDPPGLGELVADLRPIPGRWKVVIIDGHPRSGKTWSTLRAIE